MAGIIGAMVTSSAMFANAQDADTRRAGIDYMLHRPACDGQFGTGNPGKGIPKGANSSFKYPDY